MPDTRRYKLYANCNNRVFHTVNSLVSRGSLCMGWWSKVCEGCAGRFVCVDCDLQDMLCRLCRMCRVCLACMDVKDLRMENRACQACRRFHACQRCRSIS